MTRDCRVFAAALAVACCLSVPLPAAADGKVSLYLSWMDPANVDASRFTTTSWGGGISAVMPWAGADNLIAFTGGLEFTNMMSQHTDVYDPILREAVGMGFDFIGRLGKK